MASCYYRIRLTALVLFCIWNLVFCSNHDPNMAPNRTTIVHLFEWKWNDIAIECEKFLGPRGYGAVQVSPPNENGILWNDYVKRPWYERYQSVSYMLFTRSGSEQEFKEMVRKCNQAGVRIYVDTIINHMTGGIGKGHGTAGSYFDPDAKQYDGVPYSSEHFNGPYNCHTDSGDIENFNDKIQVRNCRLVGLNDLNQGVEYVRNKIVEFMNNLISIGVAGFRIDAAKHMWPGDLDIIYSRLNNLNEVYFPAGKRPFIYQEVIDWGGEAIGIKDYVKFGRVTEFRFGKHLGDVIRKNYNQQLKYLRNFGEGWAFASSSDAVTFMDNHDNQRGVHDGVLTHRESRMYKMGTAFMLAWPYGLTRVMSSFSWQRDVQGESDKNDWIGPPHDDNFNIRDVQMNPDLSCGDRWVCEHRWRQIYNMVKFRNVVRQEAVNNWWDNRYQQIAFSRGNKGFLAINNEHFAINQLLQTGLPQGTYCDVISGNKESNHCTGRSIQVDSNGHAQIFVDNTWEDPMIGIHIEAKL